MESEFELRQIAATVAYEFWMMQAAARRLLYLNQESEEGRDVDWLVDMNAFLESFLIHYRNVMDFLSPPDSSQEKKDVTCGVFLGEPFRYQLPDTPIEHRVDINTYLAHMSKGRGEGSKGWLLFKMVSGIEDAFTRFLDELPAQKRNWFIELDHPDPRVPPPDVFSSGWSDED